MTSPKVSLLLDKITEDNQDICFIDDDLFAWRPDKGVVSYVADELAHNEGKAQLIHELAHAKLGHDSYKFDINLLEYETLAWDSAQLIAMSYDLKISDKYVEKCLDTYRDWLHARSTCINCKFISLQIEPSIYRCFNCDATWRVPHTPICRRKVV